jgi:serine/threonine-protein kinase
MAVPFDAASNEVTGQPVDVLDGVLTSGNTGAAEFSTGGRRTLVWTDRSGKTETLPLPPASYLYPRLSPDGRYLAVEVEGPNHDLHIYDFARGVLTKVTTDGHSHDPVWAPDNKRVAFRSWISGGMTMWMMPVDRSAKPVRVDPSGTRQSPVSISPDGRYLAFDQKSDDTSDDAWVLPLDGGPAKPVAQSRFDEGSPKFSPDGKWIAYASAESGRSEIYVQPFPGPGPKVQISNGGGFDPVWQRSGPELYYRSGPKMMAVSIDTTSAIRVSPPRQLWEGNYSSGAASSCGMPGVTSSNYDVTADGRRFLMVRDEDARIFSTKIVVVLNWAEELKAKMAAATSLRSSEP